MNPLAKSVAELIVEGTELRDGVDPSKLTFAQQRKKRWEQHVGNILAKQFSAEERERFDELGGVIPFDADPVDLFHEHLTEKLSHLLALKNHIDKHPEAYKPAEASGSFIDVHKFIDAYRIKHPAIEPLEKLLKESNDIHGWEDTERWSDRVAKVIEEKLPRDELDKFHSRDPGTQGLTEDDNSYALRYKHDKIGFLISLVKHLKNHPEDFRSKAATQQTKSPLKEETPVTGTKVFIVHGHDGHLKTEVQLLLSRADLDDIVLHEQPDKGRTIIEKVIEEGKDACYVIALLTPDDVLEDGKKRARQNVILEIGYFIGKLGKQRVRLLKKEDVEIPSDLQGILFEPYDKTGSWKTKLLKEMKAVGIKFDLEKALQKI